MRIICHGLKAEDFPVEFLNHEISLGYAESNLIPVKAEGVSRHHAVLLEEGDSLFIKDNGSLNGTYLNRREIHGRQRLFPGDTIQIGIQHVMVEISSDRIITLNFIPPVSGKGIAGRSDEKKQENAAGKKPDPVAGGLASPGPASRTESLFVEGREIGKYIIGKRIGKGGMGEIYLAKHKTLGIYRALKVLPKDIREDNAEFFERFIREAKLASEIRHHNVVSVMDVETDPSFGFPYIVMEYVDGGSLRNSLNSNKKLSEEQAIVIVEAVASALQAAEEHKIVHRDIKPDNIMFTQQGEVKLADLGIAKNGDIDNDLTRTNMIIGTPAYLPPEQAQNAKHVDCRADIYSLGATFYEMLTGEVPYPGNNTFEIIHKLVTDPVPDPRDLNPEVSAASAAIVMKMLAKDPKNRFQNAGELLELMDRTFPPHTAYETTELIKKVLAGECENSAAFSSEITMPQTGSWGGRFSKWVALFFVGFCCFFSAFHFCTNIRPFDTRFPSAQQDVNGKNVSADETEAAAGTGAADKTQTEEIPVVQGKSYELQIRTVPDSDIQLVFPGGRKVVYSSGRDGVLKMAEMEAGRYEIKIEKKNYRPVSQVVELDDDKNLDIQMFPDVKKLIIKAQPGSEIRLFGKENKEKSMKASADGIAEFTDLLPEEIVVRVELQGWDPYEKSFALIRDREVVEVSQTRIVTILTVRTAKSAKIVLKQNGREVRTKIANSDGVVKIDDIIPGEYSLEISGDGYYPREMVCDLNRNRNLDVELQMITYELRIASDPGTMIVLYRNNQSLNKEYRVPISGSLSLPDMQPGLYTIEAGKEGMIGRSIDVTLDRDRSVDCYLDEAVATVKTEPDKQTDSESTGPQVAQQSRPGTGASTEAPDQSADPTTSEEKPEGTIRVLCSADSALINYIQENGVTISIGNQTWSDIREFSWEKRIKEGEYKISIRSKGIKEFSSSFKVSAGGMKEFAYDPEPKPASLVFDSNRADAVIKFNENSYKPGDMVACESFLELSATAEYGGKRITQTIRGGMKPETRQTMMFTFSENDSSSQEQYSEGMELFRQKRYDDALETFLPIAEEHMDAAKKIAEIYDLKRQGIWQMLSFSDSSSEDALTWYKKAADLGDPESALKVADAIFKGKFKVKEGNSARLMVQYYQMAAAADLPGKADIYYRLSNIYRDGFKTDIKADDAQAVKYLRKAAELGLPDAMYELGECYANGQHGIAANIQEGLKWIKKAADAGHSKAKRYSGNLKK